MNITQQIEQVDPEGKTYDDDITITDLSADNFPAVTAINIPEGSTTREIRVELLPLDVETPSTMKVNSGLFVRKDGETEVKVTVYKDGAAVAENTQAYA